MRIEITINGEAYPCYQTMGAMLRFKQETGREVSLANLAVSDFVIFLWCCIMSSCKHEGRAFDMSLLDFADSVTVEEMNDILLSMTDAAAAGARNEKKTTVAAQ